MAATLTTLISFDGADGANPRGDLVADSNGDIFGTTENDGSNNGGTVFEITKTAAGYASTPTILVSFNGTDGANPYGGLIADADGDLFGTTFAGGPTDNGTVFEIKKTATGYDSTPTTLVLFNSIDGRGPEGGLIADANGDLFGTTLAYGGNHPSGGSVFEIAKTTGGYSSTPTTLVSLDAAADGSLPDADLVADANGNLFGTTSFGGADDAGTVFEIRKISSGYASTPTILANFGSDAGLIADANGDLFGTTQGTVFEIKKTADGYAPTPTILINFNSASGTGSLAGLIADANGDLFGTTGSDGPDGAGTVFEIVKTAAGYANAPVTVASFDAYGAAGYVPEGTLVSDANGNLFGTNWGGGAHGDGTVFEVTDSGFATTATSPAAATPPNFFSSVAQVGVLWQNSNGDTVLWNPNGSGGYTPEDLGVVPTFWQIAGTGDFNGAGEAGILWRNSDGDTSLWNANGSGGFTPEDLGVVDTSWQIAGTGGFTGAGEGILWRNSSDGDTALWNPNGSGGFTPEDLGVVGAGWQIAGMGDFTGSGEDSILWQNSNGDTALWNPNGSGGFTPEDLGVVPTTWQIAGTGDFTGTGEDSILWQNSNGDTALWNPNGSGGFTPEDLGVVPTSWRIVETGDFTGGSESGILWRNANRDTALWNPNGSGGFTPDDLGVVGASWSVHKIFA